MACRRRGFLYGYNMNRCVIFNKFLCFVAENTCKNYKFIILYNSIKIRMKEYVLYFKEEEIYGIKTCRPYRKNDA